MAGRPRPSTMKRKEHSSCAGPMKAMRRGTMSRMRRGSTWWIWGRKIVFPSADPLCRYVRGYRGSPHARALLLWLDRRGRGLRHHGHRCEHAHGLLAPLSAHPGRVRLGARRHRGDHLRGFPDLHALHPVPRPAHGRVGPAPGDSPGGGAPLSRPRPGHAGARALAPLPDPRRARRGRERLCRVHGTCAVPAPLVHQAPRRGHGARLRGGRNRLHHPLPMAAGAHSPLGMAAGVLGGGRAARRDPRAAPRPPPEDLHLVADGDLAPASISAGRSHPDNVVDQAWASVDWTLARAMGTARFWGGFPGFFSGLFAWYAVQVHQTKYLIEIGFTPAVAAYALGFVGVGGVVGQIGLGHLSDRVGREWVWTLASAGFILCYVLLILMRQHPTPTLLYLMVACQGMLGYGLASVFGAIPAELFQGRHS